MLRFNLNTIFKARGITRPSRFLIDLGFSSTTATKIYKGHSTVLNLAHVEIMCEKLNCTPNDIIEWLPSAAQKKQASHPLTPLLAKEELDKVIQLINGLPYSKLRQVADIIKEIK